MTPGRMANLLQLSVGDLKFCEVCKLWLMTPQHVITNGYPQKYLRAIQGSEENTLDFGFDFESTKSRRGLRTVAFQDANPKKLGPRPAEGFYSSRLFAIS